MTRKSNPWLLLICMYLAGMELSACAFIGPKHEEEPQCYSRFDFEYKTVQKLVALENAYSELKTTTDQVLAELGNSKKDNAGKYVIGALRSILISSPTGVSLEGTRFTLRPCISLSDCPSVRKIRILR